uniref:Uncharacterized protein n=1 Tax=Tanacetum cinerariifolium TaxID=118510 RepID=A0A6L2NXH5_TANCI|nr:hypothetical protein [Tanacetum cinerariifolium]
MDTRKATAVQEAVAMVFVDEEKKIAMVVVVILEQSKHKLVVKLTKVNLRQTGKWVQQKSHDSSPDSKVTGIHGEASDAERADKDEAEIEADTNSFGFGFFAHPHINVEF